MVDEGQVIRGINWRSTFPFVNIFRAFRIAIHPSKLFLGLALLITVVIGGKILDGIWPASESAVPGEVDQYQAISKGAEGTLESWRADQQKTAKENYSQLLQRYEGIDSDKADAMAKNRSGISDLRSKIKAQREKTIKDAIDDYNKDPKRDGAKEQRDAAIVGANNVAFADDAVVKAVEGDGLFDTFFGYETNQISKVVSAVKRGDLVAEGGVADSVTNFLTVGPVWLLRAHTVYAILFGLLFLFAWSVFGGAIARIAAVHVARDEKISVRQAMNFSVGKFLSFASAPIIPLLIVIFIGLAVALVSLLGLIWFVGPIFIGVALILALLAGFVMTLVLLGTIGGFNLMYPTVSVEGSDSFDAISRSFSYVYARPWRMLFYTTVAVIYGAATYLFIHLFIWLMLVLTHYFVGLGMLSSTGNSLDSFRLMWPDPLSAERFTYSVNYIPLTVGQKAGAFCIHAWVMLLVAFLGAFAISIYFSANTIIYYLMRAEVDATEMDDVYLEQSDEDFGDAAPTVVAAGVTVTTTTAGGEAPAAAASNPPTA